ncbi:hypothetical protein QDY65_01420 [Pyrococcus kukulkanii]
MEEELATLIRLLSKVSSENPLNENPLEEVVKKIGVDHHGEIKLVISGDGRVMLSLRKKIQYSHLWKTLELRKSGKRRIISMGQSKEYSRYQLIRYFLKESRGTMLRKLFSAI